MNPRTPPASHKKPTLEEIKSDSKLSKSAQKLKSILKSESECSEMMDLKLFRNS